MNNEEIQQDPPITPADLADPDNLVHCEGCNSAAHIRQASYNDYAQYSCPECHYEWLFRQRNMYRRLLWELADPAIFEEQLRRRIGEAYADLMGLTYEEFVESGYDEWTEKPKP